MSSALTTNGVLLEKDLTNSILGAAIEVHRLIGPGLLESVYEECLCSELRLRDVPAERQVAIPLLYKGQPVEAGFRIDLLVADRVILEIKAVDRLLPVHDAQLLTYLKLTGVLAYSLISMSPC